MYQIENFFAPSIGPPGLSIFVEAGVTLVSGSGVTVPATTVPLPANSTSFVYLNISTAVVSHTTAGFPATNCYPIATVVTGTTGVISLVDNRPDVTASSGAAVGTVTSVGTAGIATGGPITSAGTVTVAGSGNTTTAATANANLGAAPNGDVVTTDGSGNVQDSGTLLSNLLPLSGGTLTGFLQLAPIAGGLADSFGFSGAPGNVLTVNGSGIDVWVAPVGTVSSFSAGNLPPLFTTSVATATSTPALSFSLSNASGGTVFGNTSASSGAPAYTTTPVLGIPGTSTGTITLASSTASGKFIITAPASANTATLTLPTISNVLATRFAGDGTVLSSTLSVASASGTVTASLLAQAGGTVFANANTTTNNPTFTSAPVLGIPGTSTGTITLASSTASGLFTVTAPASASTPTLTLPTTSNVLVGQLAGDGTVFDTTLIPASAAGTLTLPTPKNQTANTVFAGPTSGGAAAPTFRALVTADLPTGTGTVTSFSAGNLSPLFTTSVATATTTPALTFALSNAGGGTVFGNPTTASAAPVYTTAPVLGIPGTSTGTIALASSTASGLFTVTAPASASTPTLTLPTTSNVLAGQLAGDNTIFATTLVPASAAGTLTLPTPKVQPANSFLAGPTTGGSAAPTFRGLVSTDILGLVTWDQIQPALGLLSINNGTFTTTFQQTNNTIWLWQNTTVATVSTTNASPQLEIAANYWTGAASAQDTWSFNAAMAAGANAVPTLNITHTGSTGQPVINIRQSAVSTLMSGGISMNGQLSSTRNGAASSSTISFTGTPFTGGSGTTTFPFVYFNSGASAPTTLNTSGTIIGINAVSGFAGNFSDYRINGGASLYSVNSAGVLGNYNGIATVRNGVSANFALSDLTAQSAAIGATNLIASAPYTGAYEISWSADITTAASTSSVLGGTNGFQVIYTSPTDSVVKTTVAGNSTTSSANTTGTAVGGTITIFAKTGTAIQFSFGYTSVGATAMVFELHSTLRGL